MDIIARSEECGYKINRWMPLRGGQQETVPWPFCLAELRAPRSGPCPEPQMQRGGSLTPVGHASAAYHKHHGGLSASNKTSANNERRGEPRVRPPLQATLVCAAPLPGVGEGPGVRAYGARIKLRIRSSIVTCKRVKIGRNVRQQWLKSTRHRIVIPSLRSKNGRLETFLWLRLLRLIHMG